MKYELLNKRAWTIALIFIIFVGLLIQYPYMNEFPSFIHAWSQADRYSIAIGFINNDFDLFHPETLIYNKQFPHRWNYAFDSTITSVDFPILEYIVAIIMKITGITSPWIFRTCTLLVALLGMFFLYKLSFSITEDWIKSLLVTMIAMTSPVYAYYFNGFIPGIPALTFAIIALYCYVKYLNDGKIRTFCFSLLFITLSVLTRMSFAVIWVALLGFEFLRILRKETTFLDKLLPVAISIIVFLSYYFWNKHLAAEHGTLFLGKLLPANDWADFWDRMRAAKENWQYHYFGKIHYRLFLIILVSSILYLIYKKIRFKDVENTHDKKSLSLWIFVAVVLLGYVLFTIAMAKQFKDHDYYFIDTYFLPLLLLFILVFKALPRVENYKSGIIAFVILIIPVVMMITNVNEMQKKRRTIDKGRASERTIKNYQGSEQYLDSLGVSKEAKILSLWSYPQNTPFILMNRKGFTEMWDRKEGVDAKMSFDFDYLIVENELYDKEKHTWKYVFDDLEYYSDNGKIMIFVKKENDNVNKN